MSIIKEIALREALKSLLIRATAPHSVFNPENGAYDLGLMPINLGRDEYTLLWELVNKED